MKRALPILCGLLALLPAPPHAAAQSTAKERVTWVYVNIPPLALALSVRTATEIVHARVTSQRSVCPEDGPGQTELTVEVLDAAKGNPWGTRIVSVIGTDSELCRTVVPGSPSFEDGDEAVLFLWQEPSSGEFGILGLGQGTYRVGKTEGQRVVEGPHAAEGETPAAFLDRVDSALADDANPLDREQQENLDVHAQ